MDLEKHSLFILINHQPDIDNIYWYTKVLNEAKYIFLFKKSEDFETKHFNYSKTFIEYLNDIEDIYKYIEE